MFRLIANLLRSAARCAPPQWPRIWRLISVNIWMRHRPRSPFSSLEQRGGLASSPPTLRTPVSRPRHATSRLLKIGGPGGDREILEEQRELALFAKAVVTEVFDHRSGSNVERPVPGADPRDPWISIGRIAGERDYVRTDWRIDANFSRIPGGSRNRFAPASICNHARPLHAIVPYPCRASRWTTFEPSSSGRDTAVRSERITLQLDHRHTTHP